MPLAIELAAARVTVMTTAELLAGLDDRFQLLAGGRRRQRQRTLEAMLDWSYDLLAPVEQEVFRALGVFVDGFDLDAVAGADPLRPSERHGGGGGVGGEVVGGPRRRRGRRPFHDARDREGLRGGSSRRRG